jgi:hypothetical protein
VIPSIFEPNSACLAGSGGVLAEQQFIGASACGSSNRAVPIVFVSRIDDRPDHA